jgi:nucleoside-diphosphate-sugar epimerase
MSRVLVTGASGFIGRETLQPLLSAGEEVHAVSTHAAPADAPTGVHWHRVDLLHAAATADLITEVAPTHLLHLAWYAEPGRFWSSEENLRWVSASLELLRAFARAGGRRAVIAGTCAEYGWGLRTVCDERMTPCEPATLYGTAKHALRLLAERWAEGAGVSLAWGRVFFVFGPGEDERRLGGSVARALVRGEPARCSHGRQVRDFLSVGDLAAAFVALLRSNVEGPVNLASGAPVTVAELVQALAAAAGRPELVELGVVPAPSGEPELLTAEVGRLHDEVGWGPPQPLAVAAADTIAWWRRTLG